MTISTFMKKDRGLNGPVDFRPANNSYPVKTLERMSTIDALGPSELQYSFVR
jgi:hypothetical protein